MAMLLFTGLNGVGVVFLVYVLVQFWKEEHRANKPGTSDHLIKFSQENRPTVIVVTRPISGGLHASHEAFSVKVEPAPVSQSAHARLSVVSRQSRMSSCQDRQLHRDSPDGIDEIPMNRFSTR
jgi:hypothetical protein